MRAALPTAVLVLALAAFAHPKVAADYLHGSAQKYIGGRHQEALVEVEEGIRAFPNDPALKTMAAHLRRLKDQQRQDQGSQGSSGGEQEQDDKDKQQGEQGQGGGQEDPKDKEQEKDKGKEEGKEDEGKGAGQGEESPEDKGQDSAGAAQAPVKPGEMSKEDAERLLNSIQDDEKKEHRQQQKRWRKRPDVEQDW